MNLSRLTTVMKWLLISNLVAVVIGVVTLPVRPQLVAAIESVGIPRFALAETALLFVCTVALFYLWLGLLDRKAAHMEVEKR